MSRLKIVARVCLEILCFVWRKTCLLVWMILHVRNIDDYGILDNILNHSMYSFWTKLFTFSAIFHLADEYCPTFLWDMMGLHRVQL